MQTDEDPDRTIPVPSPGSSGRHSSQSSGKSWQAPTAEELQTMLPQYEITALLGRGGMGAVYKGTQINLDRPVAIKILPPGMDDDEGGANYTERFKNEARSMAKLGHPGIVAVYDSGETADGLLYIVMEFIEGTDVQKMVSEQGRLHSTHALAITAHVCDALQYAHERGIVHRDIKPANIMVGYDGVVKVADFGLAKMERAGESALTRTGMAMGTLHYMAPEALMLGSSVDHRADIYAVGVMLYYMLTGRLPQGMFELPSLQVSGLDPRFDGIIARSLRDDREIRYQSAVELRQELDGIITQPVIRVEPGAEKAQPALETNARPQRGGAPPPRQPAEVRVERRGSPLLWMAVLLLGGFVVWTNFKSKPPATTEPAVPASAASSTTPGNSTVPATTTAPPAATAPSVSNNNVPTTPPPAPLPLPSPGVWQQLLVEDLRQTLDIQNNRHTFLQREPGGDPQRPRYRALADMGVHAKPTFKNCAVRARFGPGWTRNPPYLMVRYQGPGRFVSNNLFDNMANLRRVFYTSSGQSNYADFARKNFNSRVILPQQTYELEFKVVGDHYTSSKDGEIILEGNDSAYTDGRVGFFVEKGALIESFEFMIVPDGVASPPTKPSTTPASATVTTSPDGWRSLLDEKPEIHTQMQVADMANGRHIMQKGFMPVVDGPNAAIRLKATGSITLVAKYSQDATNGQHGYRTHVGSGRLFSGWITRMQQVAGGWHPVTYTPGGNQPALAITAGQEYELELRSYGSHLTVLVNGKIENDLINTVLRGNMLAIASEGANEFTSLEWRPLDAAGNPLPAATASVSASAEVQKLEQQYRDALTKQVTPAVEAYALSIQGSYAAALERAIKAPGTTPAVVAALQQEVQRLASSKTVPDKDAAGTPAELTGLRDTYRKAVEAFRVQKTAPMKVIYEQQLKALEKSGGAASPGTAATSATFRLGSVVVTKDKPFVNSLGMRFVPVPGTKILMCAHPTRKRDFAEFAVTDANLNTFWQYRHPQTMRETEVNLCPVSNVSWEEAKAFCEWLGRKESRVYRMPTDREWSFAVGIGDLESATETPRNLSEGIKDVFAWGTQWPPPLQAGNLADTSSANNPNQQIIPNYTDGYAYLSPVMSFPPNALGIYDLTGNVFEWCEDWSDGQKQARVMRGGAFNLFLPNILLASHRNQNLPVRRSPNYGFRCVMEQP